MFIVDAQPKPYQLLKLTESARFFCHHWPLDKSGRTFRDYAQLTSDRLTFLITSKMEITEPMYNVKVPKNPLDITIQGGYVGNTSVTSIAEAFTKDGTKLLSNINQVVFVDTESRRPKQLPNWWKEKYAKSGESHNALKVDKYERPDMIEPYRIHVVRSDLDGNGHTNWSCYVRFSVDAIYNFVKNGKLLNLKDVDKRYLKLMEVMYSGESFDEDVLDVFVWSPDDSPNVAIVHIMKDSKFIFQGRYEYFPMNP